MIYKVNGDIFRSTCEVIVNPVNTQGVMGAGLAKKFKKRYPEYANFWKVFCKDNRLEGGYVNFYEGARFGLIASFATKEDWRNSSKIEWIDVGLKSLAQQMTTLGLFSVALPKIGCGLGGLSWTSVEPLIQQHLSEIKRVEIY